jgi:glycosyltransferase involved in cell wall biosynthesis
MERTLVKLVSGLARLGLDVTVIARTCELPTGVAVEFHRVRGPARPFLIAYPWFMLAGSLALLRWRRGVVQVTGAIVANRVDVVAVHACHQLGMLNNPSRSSMLFRAHAKLVAPLKRVGERACFYRNRRATFVCVSEGGADEIREHYPEFAKRVMAIHSGVDTEVFSPGARLEDARALRAQLELEDGRPVAAFVGSDWERKGLRPLIEALGLAEAWTLLVAGSGDQLQYQRLAEALGVASRVRWLGVTPDVQLVYAVADAFVLPSSYETFSLVTFEAAASGLAILATDVGGVRELIRDGETGLLITRDPRVIARGLERLATDHQLRQRLARAARQSALDLSWEQTIAAHHNLYIRLSQRNAVRPETQLRE